jgi:hypothetical protein
VAISDSLMMFAGCHCLCDSPRTLIAGSLMRSPLLHGVREEPLHNIEPVTARTRTEFLHAGARSIFDDTEMRLVLLDVIARDDAKIEEKLRRRPVNKASQVEALKLHRVRLHSRRVETSICVDRTGDRDHLLCSRG